MVAPGTAVREGLDNIVPGRTGALICIGESEELGFLLSGGVKLDVDYTPALLYQLAKMDGAIMLAANGTKILWANVQLMPDPTILSLETGTRHRTAERVSKQTDALVIAISAGRGVVSLYLDGAKYILEDIPVVLAKANQALATLDKYRSRLDQVSTRLTALEFEGGVTLHDVLTVLQRAELVTRMAVEIERYIVELGAEGRLIEMQLEETMVGVAADKSALVRDYIVEPSDERASPWCSTRSRGCRTRTCSTSAAWPSFSATTASSTPSTIPPRRAATASSGASRACRRWWCTVDRERVQRAGRDPRRRRPGAGRPSRASGTCERRTSARAFAACRRSTSWTGICKPETRRRAGSRP